MIPLENFLQKVLPWAPNCPELVAVEHVRTACIEFCERTRLWRFDDEFSITQDEPEFMAAPEQAEIHEIERLDFDERRLDPATPGWLDEQIPQWRSGSLSGAPKWFTQTEMDTISVVPFRAGTVRVWLRLKPSEDADMVPDFLGSQYRTAIGWGALSSILTLPELGDADRAGFFATKWQAKLAELTSRQSKGQTRAPIRTRASYF